MVLDSLKKVKLIRERLKAAQSHQKSYSNVKKKDLKFDVKDWIYLKVSPIYGMMRFGRKRKLNPRYVGLYKILK